METIINYSSYDHRFINRVVEEAEKFSDKVYIVHYDKFFDGKDEDFDKINSIKFSKDKTEIVSLVWDKNKTPKFHHNFARWMALEKCEEDYVIFLNSDEIVEGDKMLEYLESKHYKDYHAIGFDCYWYFRDPEFRAIQHEEIGFLVKRSLCNENFIFSVNETSNYKYTSDIRTLSNFKPKNETIVHHYSWVRSKEDMIRKVSSWAHRNDRDWITLVNNEFTHEFAGTDFVHGYNYELVENTFNV